MIAPTVPVTYGSKRCPSNGMTCFSVKCNATADGRGLGRCQRLLPRPIQQRIERLNVGDTITPAGKLIVPAVYYGKCPLTEKDCPHKECATGICQNPEKINHKDAIKAIEREKPNSDGSLNCKEFPGRCYLKNCMERGRCAIAEVGAATRAATTERTCPADGRMCQIKTCNEEHRCVSLANRTADMTAPKGTAGTGPANAAGTKGGITKETACHWGLYRLGVLGKATIWGGRETAVSRQVPGSQRDFALTISLIGGSSYWKRDEDDGPVTGNGPAQDLLPDAIFRRIRPVPFLNIDWPDFGVPPLDRDWWVAFGDAIKEVEGDVAIYCVGGHGRTGTMASILAVFGGWAGEGNCPVTWLRRQYCKNVVESNAQIEYIEEITGCRIMAEVHEWSTSFLDKPKGGNVKLIRGAGSPKTRPQVATRKPNTLSKNYFKKWAKKQRQKGHKVPTAGELADGELVEVDGHVFQWSRYDQKFEHCGVVNPTPNADLEPPKAPTTDTHCFACHQPFSACKCK